MSIQQTDYDGDYVYDKKLYKHSLVEFGKVFAFDYIQVDYREDVDGWPKHQDCIHNSSQFREWCNEVLERLDVLFISLEIYYEDYHRRQQ